MINPILILVLLPIFDKIIYPLAAKCNFMKKPLQRMVNIKYFISSKDLIL